MASIGPLQLVALRCDGPFAPPKLKEQFRGLRDAGFVRLVDGVLVTKNGDDEFDVVEVPDLDSDEAMFLGSLARSLFGFGGPMGALIGDKLGQKSGEVDFGISEDQLYEVADLIPRNSTAMFLLIEHLWVLGLKRFVLDSGGALLANSWITSAKLIAMGEAEALG